VFVPILAFWLLDAYYVQHERLFRSLYDSVRRNNEEEVDFSMDINEFKTGNGTFYRALFSLTLILFYLLLIIAAYIFIYYAG
jgi:hypothetical protein